MTLALTLTLGLGGISSAGDVTAPSLSNPIDEANGRHASTGSVDTDEDNGTLYWYVSTSATPPSAADLKDGTGATAFGNQTVSATGTQNIAPTGLAAGTTYYTYFLQRDEAGNESTIAAADGFTTVAPVTLDPANKLPQVTLSNGNLTWQGTNGFGVSQKARATQFVDVGEKRYCEATVDFLRSDGLEIGVVTSTFDCTTDFNEPGSANTSGITYRGNAVRYDFSTVDTVTAPIVDDVIMVAVYRVDSSNVTLFLGLNGSWLNGDDPSTLTGGWTIAMADDAYIFAGSINDDEGTYNFGETAFTYSVPTGFSAMSS